MMNDEFGMRIVYEHSFLHTFFITNDESGILFPPSQFRIPNLIDWRIQP